MSVSTISPFLSPHLYQTALSSSSSTHAPSSPAVTLLTSEYSNASSFFLSPRFFTTSLTFQLFNPARHTPC